MSDRKLRLFACADLRTRLILMSMPENLHIVEVAERFADGEASETERSSASIVFYLHHGKVKGLGPQASPFLFSAAIGKEELIGELVLAINRGDNERKAWTCRILNCIFGPMPFRSITIDLGWLLWNDGTIPKIAKTIYNDRVFDRLPILADALEEAGCTNPDLLAHCRQQEEHARGCWVVDLILGKK